MISYAYYIRAYARDAMNERQPFTALAGLGFSRMARQDIGTAREGALIFDSNRYCERFSASFAGQAIVVRQFLE